jgi:hypothetical protein
MLYRAVVLPASPGRVRLPLKRPLSGVAPPAAGDDACGFPETLTERPPGRGSLGGAALLIEEDELWLLMGSNSLGGDDHLPHILA